MTEVQEPGAEMLHWAEQAYYNKSQKEKRKKKERCTTTKPTREERERDHWAKLPKEKLEHLP
jgi:hypothetical protein